MTVEKSLTLSCHTDRVVKWVSDAASKVTSEVAITFAWSTAQKTVLNTHTATMCVNNICFQGFFISKNRLQYVQFSW